MAARVTGETVEGSLTGVRYRAFVPKPLPPDPPIDWSGELSVMRDRANQSLGRLDGIVGILPDTDLFLYQYIRKEAVLSSQIEGTQSTLSDLLLFELDETPGVPIDDVREVSNYVAAIKFGLKRIAEGMPISLRLLKDIHGVLLKGGRGKDQEPGEFRRTQVWLGGKTPAEAEFVPPPPERLMEFLGPFEFYLNDKPEKTPVLVKAALSHVQFETIHPFKDGNGRLGRLLITLLLCSEKTLLHPTLYLSLYFKQNREEYYDRLQAVRLKGDWEGWVQFFFKGVIETSELAVNTAQRLRELFSRDRKKLQQIGRVSGSALRIHQLLQEKMITSIPSASQALTLSYPATNRAIGELEKQGLIREITGQRRNRNYVYSEYLSILSEGTEPLNRSSGVP